MSEKPVGEKLNKTGSGSGAESPTTARELDFDDDNETTAPAPEQVSSPPPPSKSPKPGVRFSDNDTEIPPPKPPRPVDPQQQALNTLAEAFPNFDRTTIRGMLVASRGNIDDAFNALLSMSDPSFKDEDLPTSQPPAQPPRPNPRQPRSQVEQDEIYARQLAQHYQSAYAQRGEPRPQQQQHNRQQSDDSINNNEPSFEEDFKEIRRNFEAGFTAASTKISTLIGRIANKIDPPPEEFDEYGNEVSRRPQRQNFGPSQSDQLHGIRRSAESRRSADRDRYDNDNRVLGDDFEALELRDDEVPANQKSNRPLANPDLFKPTPVSPPQTGPVDEVDALYRNPSPGQQTGVTGNKSSGKKWQPLTSVAPHPESDEHDPFSLGDSDDEDAKTKDIKADDTERLKKAAEAKDVKESTSSDLRPAGRSGSVGQIDATAEALLKDTK